MNTLAKHISSPIFVLSIGFSFMVAFLSISTELPADEVNARPSLNGTWKWESGFVRFAIQLRHEADDKLTGNLTIGLVNGPDFDSVEIEAGICDGDDFAFTATGKFTPNQEASTFKFEGAKIDGRLEGTYQTSAYPHSLNWTAQRVVGWRNDGSGHSFCSGPDPNKQLKQLWRTELPHRSNGSPILVGDRVFVTAEPNLLICLSAITGEILWQRTTSYLDLDEKALTPPVRKAIKAAELELLKKFSPDGLQLTHNPWTVADEEELPERYQRPKVHLDAGYTTPTPASDGKSVFVHFGTGLVASYTLDGNQRWCTYPVKPDINWGHASSPVLCGGKLIIHAQDCLALDPETGKELWRTPVRKRWATPCVIEPSWVVLGGGEVLRVDNGKIVQDLFPHDKPCDPLVDYWGASSPVVDGKSVYFVDATPVDRNEKVRPTVQRFDLCVFNAPQIEFKKAWSKVLPNGKYYASPVVRDGKLFVVISTYIDKWDDYDGILNKRANGTLLILSTETGDPVGPGIQLGRDTGTYHTCSFASNSLWITGHTGELRILPSAQASSTLSLQSLPARSHPLFLGEDVIVRGDQAIVRYSN